MSFSFDDFRLPKSTPHFIFRTSKPGKFGSFIDHKWEEVTAIRKAMLEELEDEFRQGIERGSEELRVDLAVVLRALDKKEEAIEELEKAESRKDRHAYYPLGRLYLEQEDLSSGEDNEGTTLSAITGYLQKAIQLDPDNIPAHFFLGKALKELIQQESNDQIIEAFDTYLKAGSPLGFEDVAQEFLNSQNPKLQLKANLKEAKDDLESEELADAIKLLEKVIEIEEEERFYEKYAEDNWNELEEKEKEEAEMAGRDLVEALFFLGQAYERAGNLPKAIDAYRRAKKIKVSFLGLNKAFSEALSNFYKNWDLVEDGIQAFAELHASVPIKSENEAARKELIGKKEHLQLIRSVIGGNSNSWVQTYYSNTVGEVPEEDDQYLFRMDVSPSGEEILVSQEEGRKLLIINSVGKEIAAFEPQPSTILAAKFSPDGSLILISLRDKTIKLLNRGGKEIIELTGHTDPVACLAFSPDGTLMLTGSGDTADGGSDNIVRLFNMEGTLIQVFEGYGNQISALSFSPDQSNILVASIDGKVHIFKVDGKLLNELDTEGKTVTSASFSPDGSRVLTTGTDGYVAIWTKLGKEYISHPLEEINISEDIFFGAFSSDAQKLIVTTEIGQMFILDTKGNVKETILTPEGPFTYASFIDQDEKVVGVNSFGYAYIWESPKAQWRRLVAYGQEQLKK